MRYSLSPHAVPPHAVVTAALLALLACRVDNPAYLGRGVSFDARAPGGPQGSVSDAAPSRPDTQPVAEDASAAAEAPVAPDASAARAQTLYTTQVPTHVEAMNAPPWELGLRFSSNVPGDVVAIRYWRAPGDRTRHVGHIWSDSKVLLATVPFENETESGWQEATVPTRIPIAAATPYVVSVDTMGSLAFSLKTLAAPLTSTNLSSLDPAGVFGDPGTYPDEINRNILPDYFRDVVFVPR